MRVDLLSHTGTIAASSAGANLFGERLATDESSAICKALDAEKELAYEGKESLALVAPIALGRGADRHRPGLSSEADSE